MAIQRGYPDLHDHVANLDKEGLLIRVKRPMNKEMESRMRRPQRIFRNRQENSQTPPFF